MLIGVGCLVALWCVVPFFYEPSKPLSLAASVVCQPPVLPDELVQEEIITIFIHGSLHVPLAFLSPFCVLNDSFTGVSWYERTMNSLRHHAITQQPGVVLADGLHEVTDLVEQESLVGPARYSGACHTVRAFRRLCGSSPCTIRRLFTFGWSGILSERARKKAAQDLYYALAAVRQESLLKGKRVRVELYAFSHGGQVALYLPLIRKEEGAPDITVDLLVLSAVPLYYHSARNLLMGMFSTTINCYSPGDFAQTIDRFSAPNIPHQTIAETIPLPQYGSFRIVDLAIRLGKSYTVPHCAFFDINQLNVSSRRMRRSEAYRNRYQGVYHLLENLHPLPLVVLYPHILEPLYSYLQTVGESYHTIELSLQGTSATVEGTYTFTIVPHQPIITEFSWPLSPLLKASQLELKDALNERGLANKALCLWHETIHAIGAFWKR